MSLVKSLRSRRESLRQRRELGRARNHRAINRAIENAATPVLRDELIFIAQHAQHVGQQR